MSQQIRNITTELTEFSGDFDNYIVSAGENYSVTISVLRAAIYITQENVGDEPYILSIKIQVEYGSPVTVRQIGILPDNVVGKFIDIITQFSPSNGWALGRSESLILSISPPLQAGDKIVVFGLTGEEPLPVVAE